MRPSQHELPGIWAATARPEPTVAATTRAGRLVARAAPTTPWVRDAASFLGTVAAALTVMLGAMGLFFPSWLFAA